MSGPGGMLGGARPMLFGVQFISSAGAVDRSTARGLFVKKDASSG
jgi:hypothetical protein